MVTIIKVRPDVNSQAVMDSKAALEQLMMLQAELRRDRDDWRERTRGAERLVDDLRHENSQQQGQVEHLEEQVRVLVRKLARLQGEH